MNTEHHNEQMEAAREKFKMLWETDLSKAAFDLSDHRDRQFAAMQVAWLAFMEGIKQGKSFCA